MGTRGEQGWGGAGRTYIAGGGTISTGTHHHIADAEPPVQLALQVGEQGQGHLLQHCWRRRGYGQAGWHQHPPQGLRGWEQGLRWGWGQR